MDTDEKQDAPKTIFQKLADNLLKITFVSVIALVFFIGAISVFKKHRTVIKPNVSSQNTELKTVTIFNDIQLKVHDDTFSHDAIRSEYKKSEIVSYLKRNVKEGDTIIEISYDIGIHTLLMAKLIGQAGRIYVYNPYLKYVDSINASAEANEFGSRIFIQCLGISDHTYDGLLIHKNNFPLMSGKLKNKDSNIPVGHSAMVVKISSIDEQLPNLQKISFLKIDVNGDEAEIIDGAINLIKKSDEIKILLSFNKETLEGYAPIKKLLLMDFRLYKIQKDGLTEEIKIEELDNIKDGYIVLKR